MIDIYRTFYYWFKAIIKPRDTLKHLHKSVYKVEISFFICLVFGLCYSITAFIFYITHRLPVIQPWIPIDIERYYLYQSCWTVAWGLATWIMLSGTCHLLAIIGKKDRTSCTFEDALMVVCIGWVVPSTVLMWIPETFIIPFFGTFWPFCIEILRVMVVPTIWQVLLVAIGLKMTHKICWTKGIGIGLLTVVMSFIMFMAFMR